jgi:citrate lyase subunit beta/citryl-CoA lyase
VAHATTFLFVPGDRPDRFAKAVDSGADVVILDLEDAVALTNKVDALAHVIDALTPGSASIRALVRVNAQATYLAQELVALRALVAQPDHGLLGVMHPKTESTNDLEAMYRELGLPVVALIETAAGIANANDIARAPGVARLAFGAVDFARDVNATEPAVFDVARAQIVIAARAAGLVAPIDSPAVSIHDFDLVETESRRAAAFGFGAKMCIHPAQVPAIVAGFTPSDDQVAWATQVVALEGSATQLDGEMIDKPVVDRAKSILRRTDRA